ncbi:hypothetical protein LRS06_15035 [Hymenobacter sp. J193]|uniref:hypothetical protein n=1 Tax=Hymenobacter sp. J193 TaxID=2898429 RepID=UPI0021508815|nr:hypothetical protein [Hymenobacter sp. J193]MCR5889059.1 hypothetical protein [Hymenobacter sp. J193]
MSGEEAHTMAKLSKPKHCGQNWLEMTPAVGGRLCEPCGKVVTDFTKMTWAEIEEVQWQHNYAACGMYSAKQIANWDKQEAASPKTGVLVAATVSLALVAGTAARAQTADPVTSQAPIILYGQIQTVQKKEVVAVSFSVIGIKNANQGVLSNEAGNYRLEVPASAMANPAIVTVQALGYAPVEVDISQHREAENRLNIVLHKLPVELSGFSIPEPTLRQRLGLDRWQRKREQKTRPAE